MNKTVDYLIIGAGPAGLQMAYHLEKSNRNYLILEKSDKSGSFFSKYPRHRKLISINKVYTGSDDLEKNLRWDWNSILSDDPSLRLSEYSKEYFPNADVLVDYLNDYANKLNLNIAYNSEVVKVDKMENGDFKLDMANGDCYQAKVLIVATGIFKLNIPDIPGIEHCEGYTDCSVDPEDFINKRVLIVGKGNSGFETADNLVGTASTIHIASPSPLNLAWQTHFVGHLRAVNNNFLDTYQLKSQNAIIDADIDKVEKRDGMYYVTYKYTHANGEVEEIPYDHVILATGFKFDASIFADGAKPVLAINDRFPAQTHEWESINVENMYFIGAVTQQRDFKKHTSAFIHGFRYNVECLAGILNYKHEQTPFPETALSFSAEAATDALIKRINQTSSLWQQFGFIGDLLVVDTKEEKMSYIESLPVDYIHQSENWKGLHQFIMTLEYGKFGEENVFALERDPKASKASDSKFLHPIIKHYFNGELVSEHHIIEDLETDWTKKEMHIMPLQAYMEAEFAAIRGGSSTKETAKEEMMS